MNTELLKNRDYSLVLDRSGSMGIRDQANGKSRWSAVQESTEAIARKLEEYDPDGITLYPFSDNFKKYEGVTADRVSTVFQENDPMGGTNLASALKASIDDYFARKAAGKTKANGDLIVVVTDGQPDNQQAVADLIIGATQKMDRDEELGITFLQVGNDQGATSFLQYLDDNLVSKGAKFDIVDTKTFDQIGSMPLNEVLLSAIGD